MTPMLEQYVEWKDAYPDCLLFFRMGDFYEMFFDDAEIASSVLDIALTSRSKENEYKTLLANIMVWSKPEEPVSEQSIDDGNHVIEQPKVQPPISAKNIRTSYSKPLIGNESEVEEYINSLRDAYMQEIRNGKKIQL